MLTLLAWLPVVVVWPRPCRADQTAPPPGPAAKLVAGYIAVSNNIILYYREEHYREEHREEHYREEHREDIDY